MKVIWLFSSQSTQWWEIKSNKFKCVFLDKVIILSFIKHHCYLILKWFLSWKDLCKLNVIFHQSFSCFSCLVVLGFFSFSFSGFWFEGVLWVFCEHLVFLNLINSTSSFLYICHSYLGSQWNFLLLHFDGQGNPLCSLTLISKWQKILQFNTWRNFHYFYKI